MLHTATDRFATSTNMLWLVYWSCCFTTLFQLCPCGQY